MTLAERFGRNLARHREPLALSQEDLGLRAGLHRTAVGQLERGERIPRADTVVKLAGSLGIETELLFEGLSWNPAEMTLGTMAVAAMDDGAETGRAKD